MTLRACGKPPVGLQSFSRGLRARGRKLSSACVGKKHRRRALSRYLLPLFIIFHDARTISSPTSLPSFSIHAKLSTPVEGFPVGSVSVSTSKLPSGRRGQFANSGEEWIATRRGIVETYKVTTSSTRIGGAG